MNKCFDQDPPCVKVHKTSEMKRLSGQGIEECEVPGGGFVVKKPPKPGQTDDATKPFAGGPEAREENKGCYFDTTIKNLNRYKLHLVFETLVVETDDRVVCVCVSK